MTASSASNEKAALRVERCVTELQRGRKVVVEDGRSALVFSAVEALGDTELARLLNDGASYRLVVAGERAVALGWTTEPVPLEFSTGRVSADTVQQLAGLHPRRALPEGPPEHRTCPDRLTRAALQLAREGHLLPALLRQTIMVDEEADLCLHVTVDDVLAYRNARGALLTQASRARVPLAGHDDCEFIVFRERYGDAEHVAIVVGTPDRDRPVLTRLHSSCLTGDLFDSLRCDCGEQLRGAIARIANAGGGVLLYVDQEGRDIGLANKLRAYQLQDAGLDTLDANLQLGFRSDERSFTPAAAMLEALGIPSVRLLTNNPAKIDALRDAGVDVVGRTPIEGRVNPHNAFYIDTKRKRAGHLYSSSATPTAS